MNFNINKGERIGLIGRNGHGKTTLFQMILGNIESDSGEIIIPADYRIGHLKQQISFSHSNVLDEASSGLPENERNDIWKAKKILLGLGFSEDDFIRDPLSFSSGFQIRLNLAKEIVSEPDLLLLDEPNNYLDIISIRWLITFLNSCRKELMLITHDRNFMDSITTHTMIIHRNAVRKFKGGTDNVFRQIAKEEEIFEKTRLNYEKKKQKTADYIRRFRAKARMAKSVQSSIKALAKHEKLVKLDNIRKLDFAFNSAPFTTTQMMNITDISFSYSDNVHCLFKDLSFNVNNNDRICIMGKNGKGKTTLLKILAGLLSPDSGAIKKHAKLKTGYYAESDISTLNDHKSVYEEIMGFNNECIIQQVRNICGTLMFDGDNALKNISVLSGGEKSRVLLGKLLVKPCNLLLLDEPTNHLDMESCDAILDAIDAFSGAVILVTHNEEFLHRIATRLIVFNRNKLSLFEGTYQDFLDDIGWEDEKEYPEDKGTDGDQDTGSSDKKTVKILKARLRQQRFNVLTPLEEKLKEYEQRITKMEHEYEENNELLIQASIEGNGTAIAELSKKGPLLKADINDFYSKLEKTTAVYEERRGFFKNELEKLG
ncbi:MAG: ABC-F family ATP-binding cassette domain-containing protein [Elusimicrobiota bacterium]